MSDFDIESIEHGDVFLAELKSDGPRQRGYRPIVVVQADVVTEKSNMVTIVPLSSKTGKGFYGDILIEKNSENGLFCDSLAKMTHVQTLAKERMSKKIGTVTTETLGKIKDQLTEHFGL